MKLSLIVLTAGKSAGKAIPITLSQFIIGRDPQCNLRPASPMISKRHCALLVKAGKVFIRDFDSTNGTFINNEQVKGEREIKNDDVLKVGPLEFKVVLEITTPVNKPTPAPVPAKASGSPQNDDDVAAMLLSLQDDSGSEADSGSQEVPAGSTVMDIVPGMPPDTKEEAAPKDGAKPDAKKEAPKPSGNTSQAAKAILEKYTRRSRS
jgi:pSer/pThr/pTyr-binding forkhead associated (FHA) protein